MTINRYILRTQNEFPLVSDPDSKDEDFPFKQGAERWHAVVEVEGSSQVLFNSFGATEREAIENLKLAP